MNNFLANEELVIVKYVTNVMTSAIQSITHKNLSLIIPVPVSISL